jgi:hypothetical protein
VVFPRFTQVAALATLSLVAAACPQQISVVGQTDGSSSPDSGSPGGDAAQPLDSGSIPDSGPGQDAGPGQDSGAVGTDSGTVITWSNMISASSEGPYSVWGASPTNVYVVGSTGVTQHYDGNLWSVVYQSTSNLDLHGVWVDSAGDVFAGGEGQLVQCTAPCTQMTSFTNLSVPPTIMGVCGSSSQNVYAVGNDQNNNGYLYGWSGSSWTQLSSTTNIVQSSACWVNPTDGTLFIAGQSYVWRFSSGGFTQEPVSDYQTWTVSEIANQYWSAVWGSGSTVFAAGSFGRILARQASGTWTLQPPGFNPSSGVTTTFNALAGWTPAEVYTAGSGCVSGELAARFNGTTWAFIPDIWSGVAIFGMWAAGPNEYFAVGEDGELNVYLLHGTR